MTAEEAMGGGCAVGCNDCSSKHDWFERVAVIETFECGDGFWELRSNPEVIAKVAGGDGAT